MSTVSAIRALFTAAAPSVTDEQVRQENLAVAEGLKRRDAALLDLRTFRSRDFALAVAMMTLAMVPLFGAFIVLPQFARYTLGLEPIWVGALLLPGGLLMGLAGPTVGRLYDRFGPRPLVIPGAIGLAVSLWTMAFGLGEGASWIVLLAAHIVLMLSLAFLFTPAFSSRSASISTSPMARDARSPRIDGMMQNVQR